jgi:hypothetical protein
MSLQPEIGFETQPSLQHATPHDRPFEMFLPETQHQWPLTPAQVLDDFGFLLPAFEKREILAYTEAGIYALGCGVGKAAPARNADTLQHATHRLYASDKVAAKLPKDAVGDDVPLSAVWSRFVSTSAV